MPSIEILEWATMGPSAIYSVDFHPDGTRFAAAQESKIRIFLAPNLVQHTHRKVNEADLSEQTHVEHLLTDPDMMVLCTLDLHDNNVNCVRFSPDGTMLAAGSDDSRVSIHTLQRPLQLDNLTAEELEQRQSEIVQSSAWGKKNVEEWGLWTLFKHHTQDVSDICWSPDSRYVASCGVEGRVYVYDVKEKRLHWDSRDLESGHVKGVAWDPIAKYLAAQSDRAVFLWDTNTWEMVKKHELFNYSISSTCYFYRMSWACDGSVLFVGNGFQKKAHRAYAIPREKSSGKIKSLVAHENFVSVASASPVWYYNPERPETHRYAIALGSMDNKISIWFSNASAPSRLSDILEDALLDLRWSTDGYQIIASSNNGKIIHITYTEGELGERMEKGRVIEILKQQYGDFSTMSTIMESPAVTRVSPLSTAHLADAFAKRRTPATQHQQQQQQQQQQQHVNSAAYPSQLQVPVGQQQLVTRTSDGRRRIKATLVSPVTPASQVPQPQSSSGPEIHSIDSDGDEDMDNGDKKRTSHTLPPAPNVDVIQKGKRKLVNPMEYGNVQEDTIRYAKRPRIDDDQAEAGGAETEHNDTSSGRYVRKISETDELLCDNNGNITYVREGSKRWLSFIGEKPILVVGNNTFIAAAGLSNALHILSTHGRRIFPPMILDSKVHIMHCNKQHHLVVLTEDRTLSLWDVTRGCCLTPSNLSVDDLESRYVDGNITVKVDDVRVNEKGVAIVTLSNGESFTYHRSMKAWFCIASAHTVLAPTVPTDMSGYVKKSSKDQLSLDALKSHAAIAASDQRLLGHVGNGLRIHSMNSHTKEDMEMTLAAADAIGDKKSYLSTVSNYVALLNSLNDTDTLRDLFQSLLGPTSLKTSELDQRQPTAAPSYNPMVCGVPKRTMLQHLLSKNYQNNLATQRLVTEFCAALAECSVEGNSKKTSSSKKI